MYKIFSVVYFSLFIVTLVKCNDLNEELLIKEDVEKVSKQHKTKLTLKHGEVKRKVHRNGGLELNTGPTEESPSNINKQEENFTKSERSDHTEEPSDDIIETNLQEDVSRTSFVGSYTRRLNTDEITDSIDYDTDNDSSEENVEIERSESLADDTVSEEVLIYTPNIKSLARDIVLDVKARSGNAEFEDSDLDLRTDTDELDENISKIGHFPPHNTNMRSGYTPTDYNDEIVEPSDVNLLVKGPSSGYNYNLMPQSYQPYTIRPDMMLDRNPNSLPRFSPFFFESVNSRELLYSNPNSRENIWGQGFGQLRNIVKTPYFGLLQPNNQIYNPRTRERCQFCQQGLVSSRERNFRRSAEAEPSKFQTANGRSLDVEPIEANAYPLIPIEDTESEEALRIQDNLSQEVFGTPSEGNRASEVNPLSKLIITYPPYYPRRNPMISNRRFGLGGIHRIFG